MAKSKARFLSELLGSTGLVKKSKSALAGADEVLDLDTIPTIPNSKLSNSSISIAGHSTALGESVALTTGNITEHTNYKYFTEARARGAVSVSGDLAYNSSSGVISFTERTDTEVRGLVSAGGNLSYNSSTGAFSYTTPTTIASLSNHDTADLAEGTNLYYTNARARGAVSVSGSTLSYNSTTGVITSSANNYVLPTATSSAIGGVKIGYSENGKNYPVELSSGQMYVNVPWVDTNTTYSVGDGGLTQNNFTNTLKTKLDGIATSANNYVLPFTNNSSNWNTAYGWGNHASAGYLTSYTETDTLDSVTDRGATTTNAISTGAITSSRLNLTDATAPYIVFTEGSNTVHMGLDGGNFWIRQNGLGGGTELQINSDGTLNVNHNAAFTGTVTWSGGSSTNANTAYGWGNHASAGYLTSHQSLAAYAPLASPALTGTPTAPTASAGTNTTQIATTAFVGTAVSNLVDSSPSALNTLNELAAALGDDANFSTTVTNSIATKLSSSSYTAADVLTKIKTVDGSGSGLNADTVDGVQASRIIYGSNSSGTSEGTFTNWNSINKSGFYSDDGASNKWSTANWSSVLHHKLYSSNNNYATQLGFDTYNNNLYTRTNNNGTWTSWDKIWHAGVDGSGSGLDADTVDGIQGASFLRSDAADTATGALTFEGALLSKAHSSGDNWMPYTDGNFYFRAPNVFFDNNVEFNDEARVVTGSITTANSTKGLMFDGNYQTGQYRHRLRKRDMGGGIPLYIDYAHSTANSYTELARFGTYSGNSYEFEVQGDINATGNLYDGGNAVWHAGNDGSGSGLDADLLDGQHGSYYLAYGNLTGTPTIPTIPSNNVVEGGTSYSGEYPMVARTSANTIYSHNGIKFNGAQNKLTVAGSVVINGGTSWHSGNDGSGSGLDADNLDGVTWGSYKATGHTMLNVQAGNGNALRFWNGNTNYQITMAAQGTTGYGRQGFEPNSDYNMYFRMDGGTNRGFVFQDGSSNKVGIDSLGNIRADGVISSDNKQAMNCAHWSASSTSTGAIKIALPGTTSNHSMPVIEVTTYDYSSKAHVIYTISGHNWSTTSYWYNTRVTSEGGPPLTVRLGHDGTTHCIIIGETNTSWSYGSVTVALKVHPAHYASSQNFTTGWSASQITSIPSTTTAVGVGQLWHTNNDGSGSGLDADLLDGQQGSYYNQSQFTGSTFTSRNSSNAIAIDNVTTNMIGYVNSSTAAGYSDGAGFSGTYSSSWVGQLFIDFRTGKLSTRGKNNGTWQSHRFMWDNLNDGSGSGLDADLLDGIQASGFVNQNGTYTLASGYSVAQGDWGIRNTTPHGWIQLGPANTGHAHIYTDRSNFYFNKTLLYANGNLMWHAANDGSGSTLDADTVDGIQGASFLRSDATDTATGSVSLRGGGNHLGNHEFAASSTSTGYGAAAIELRESNYTSNSTATPPNLGFHWGGVVASNISMDSGGAITIRNNPGTGYENFRANNIYAQGTNLVWHTGNDGSGSGLDADLLDGQQGSYYAPNSSLGNYVHKNANTMTGSSFKMGFHSGSGGTTFGANHYSMGVDVANGAWSGPNYSDLIIGYHTGIRIGAGYSGIRFYNNSPTTDTNNTGNGNGSESLLMTIGGGGTTTSGAHVTVENNLYVKDNLYMGSGGNDGYFYSDQNGRTAFGGGDFYIQSSVGNCYLYATNTYLGAGSGDNIYLRGNTMSGNGWSLTGAGILDLDGGHGALNITNSSILSSATSTWTGNPGSAGKIQYHDRRWYIVSDSSSNSIVQFRRDGSDKSYIDNNGALIGGGNWYSGNDGSGSGLDADTVDGIQGSSIVQTGTSFGGDVSGTYNAIVVANNSHQHSQLYENATITYGASQLQWLDNNGTGGTGLNGSHPANGFSDWHHHLVMNHGNSGGYYTNLQCSFHSDRIHYRRLTNGTLTAAVELFHTGNDGSGSGLDADLLDGQHGSYYYSSANYPPRTNFENTYNNLSTSTGSGANLNSTFTNSRSGNFDCWSGSNFPPSTTHVQGIQVRHTTSTHYGWQLASQYNQPGKMYFRNVSNGTFYSWYALYSTVNDGSGSGLDADLLDGAQGSSYLRSDTADTFTGTLTMGTQQALVANNYGRGVFGLYSATRYQHVWSMGTSYKTHDSGTSYGNMYGLTFTHTNIGTGTNQAISGLSHQLQLRMNGTLYAAIGAGIWTSGNVTAYSDIAVKRNLVRIPNALEKVCSINGYTYERTDYVKDPEDKNAPDILRQAGVVAQEIEKVLPEVVSGEDGNKAVAYGNVVALLIESIKELKDEVDDLKQQLKEK